MGTTTFHDPVVQALFPKVRRAVLGLLYGRPDERFYLRQVVSLVGLGHGQTQRELARLADAEILVRTEEGRHIYFQSNPSCPVYDELRRLITKTVGAAAVLRSALASSSDRIASAFIFGSVARGEEHRASDLDLMVIGRISFAEVVDVLRVAEQELARDISATVYSSEEFRSKRFAREHFVSSVLESERIFVVGDAHDLAKLLGQ